MSAHRESDSNFLSTQLSPSSSSSPSPTTTATFLNFGKLTMEGDYYPSDEDVEKTKGTYEDLSYSDLIRFPEFLQERAPSLQYLKLDHNDLSILSSPFLSSFTNLVTLDVSNNGLKFISNEITLLSNLKALLLRNNFLEDDSLPKDLGLLQNLELINLSGNRLQNFPMQMLEITELKYLYLGGNQISRVPGQIRVLQRLEVLYLGGNQLSDVPAELGQLHRLIALVLCDNHLQSLPATLIQLRRLQSLSLHNNQLQTLPPGIVTLDLVELSLRNNPLVVRFVREMSYDAPSLLELAGRVTVVNKIKYTDQDLPKELFKYLKSYHCCVNPRCKGVYFAARVEHVKFVDFCGKYRLPLMEYLCSPRCSTSRPAYIGSSSDSETDEDSESFRLKKVLLG